MATMVNFNFYSFSDKEHRLPHQTSVEFVQLVQLEVGSLSTVLGKPSKSQITTILKERVENEEKSTKDRNNLSVRANEDSRRKSKRIIWGIFDLLDS